MPPVLSKYVPLAAVVVLAAVLRLWGICAADPVVHPDEFRFVLYPLLFFSGDLNPHFFSYPSFHFYLLAAIQGVAWALQWVWGAGWSVAEFAAYYVLWDEGTSLFTARSVGVGFALGTVLWTALLAERVRARGWVAALLLAVGVLHVRQSALACVDVPMAFWFVGAVWASLRLLQQGRMCDYLLAGILVGMAAGTKYPASVVGATVVCAHVMSRPTLLDRRLWLAGGLAVIVFALTSPYLLLDFASFVKHLSFELRRVQHEGGEGGWLYHIWVSLRYNLGWPGWLALWAAALWQIARPTKEEWVLWSAFAAFYLAISWGEMAFVRYAMPLLPLQAVLVARLFARINAVRWRYGILALVALVACYNSLRVVQLQGSQDTRQEARAWLEQNAPEGTSCCNFGGWAGDVPVRGFADLGLRLRHFARTFGVGELLRLMPFLQELEIEHPFYRYALHGGNQERVAGDVQILLEEECQYAIVHRHVLPYSRVDSAFFVGLAERGQREALFAPVGYAQSAPRYDISDAYYLPIGDFGALRQPGPIVEIWRLSERVNGREQTAKNVLMRAFVTWAELEWVDENNALALEIISYATTRDDSAVGLRNLAAIYADLGRDDEAITTWLHALEHWPRDSRIHYNIGVAFARKSEYIQALPYLRKAVGLHSDSILIRNALATCLALTGQPEEAREYLQYTLVLEPENAAAMELLDSLERAVR
jgi:hypothetical protein